MKKVLLLSLLSAFFALPTLSAGEQPDLIAVKFHADWCGSCKKMGNVFTDLQNKMDGQSILFVTLDKTNSTTKHQANLLAGALGLSKVVKNNKGTGFILLLDGKTLQVKAKLTADNDIKAMTKKIQESLS